MRIIITDPITDNLWRELLNQYSTSIFHTPEWISIIAETYDWEPQAVIVVDNNEIPQAGLTYFFINDIRGDRLVSQPFSDHCDPLVKKQEHWKLLLDHMLEYGSPFNLRCLHNYLPIELDEVEIVKRAKWHEINVEDSETELWARLQSSARRAIRKFEKNDANIQFCYDKNTLKNFFNMHVSVRKNKYRLLPQPYRFFELIWEKFIKTDNGVLITAFLGDQAIGCALYLVSNDTLVYKFSTSDLNHLEYRPTDMIIWKAMQYAKKRNLRSIDLGLSDLDQNGLIRFKRKYATLEKEIMFARFDRGKTPVPYIRDTNQMLNNLTELLTEESVPNNITVRAGETLYRYFA